MDEAQRQALRHTMWGTPNHRYQSRGADSGILIADGAGKVEGIRDDWKNAMVGMGCSFTPPPKKK